MNLQRVLTVILIAFSVMQTVNAQSVKKGDIKLQLGAGLLPTYFMDNSQVLMPPVNAMINYQINPVLSVGAYAGYSSSRTPVQAYDDGSLHRWQNNSTMAGLRLAAHSNKFEKFDVYGGFQLTYLHPEVSHTILVAGEKAIPQPKVEDDFIYSGFIGVTGYVTRNFGIFGEIGYGISLLNLGLTIKV